MKIHNNKNIAQKHLQKEIEKLKAKFHGFIYPNTGSVHTVNIPEGCDATGAEYLTYDINEKGNIITRKKTIYAFFKKENLIKTVKRELNINDSDIAEWYNYKNTNSYANSGKKEFLENVINEVFIRVKKSVGEKNIVEQAPTIDEDAQI